MLCMAQENLVLNPSFEEYSDCPQSVGQWTVSGWETITFTPDYFHACAPENANYSANSPRNIMGYQTPVSGAAYVGISAFGVQNPEAREFLSTELKDPLEWGIRYVVSLYVSAANRAQYAISTLGVALTTEPPQVITVDWPNGMVDAVPQVMLDTRIPIIDTAKWVLICDTILATGGERYLTIGNFHLDGESDTVRFNPNQPPIYGSPTTFAYYYIDDVYVVALDSVPSGVGIDEVGREYGFKVYPNPSNGILTIEYSLGLTDVGTAQLFDLSGRCVHHSTLIADANLTKLGLSHVSSGLYLLRIAVNGDTKLSEQISIVNP